jgi:glycosyltransferase involved in cell wall biosynthesis
MKRILIVTYYWPPSGGAGVQRWVKLSKYFAQQGIIPYIVTVDPAKASYALKDATLEQDISPEVRIVKTSTREPYGIYKTLTGKKDIPFGGFANEEKEKLRFSQRVSRFIRGNLFLPDARRGWNRFAYKACCELIEREKIDAVITTSPPHSTQLVGLKLKRKYKLPWLVDLRDPWTGIYYYDKLLLTDFSKRRDTRMEREVLENSDAVVTVSDAISRSLLAKSPSLQADKFHVVPNGFDTDDFNTVVPEKKENGFTISYTGTLTGDYRLEGFLEAVKMLSGEPMVLKITGSMPQNVQRGIESAAPGKVKFRNHVSHHEAIAQMKAADLLLLVIPDAKGNEGILTGKLFEYLASYKPILCIGPNGDAAGIIRDCNSGETFFYTDAKGMAKFLRLKLEEWKANGSTSSGERTKVSGFSREEQARELVRILAAFK